MQSNWDEYVKKTDGVFWVTFKELLQQGDHDKIKKVGDTLVAIEDNFTADIVAENMMKLCHKKLNKSGYIYGQVDYFSNIQGGSRVTCMDVSAGGLGVLAGGSEKISVWDTNTGTVRRVLEGHVGEVYTTKLFPSGIVVLSGGADMQLKIWSAKDGSCPVTMTGHTQAITDTAIVGVGKNIISVSKDGSARLWNCGEKKCVAVLATVEDQIISCDISQNTMFHPLKDTLNILQGEVDTEGKVLAMGGENGSLNILNVAAKKILFSTNLGSPVNSVILTKTCVYAGCQDGKLHFIQSGQEMRTLSCSNSPVLSLLSVMDGVCVSRQDGSATIHHNGDPVYLTGPDTEPVYRVVSDSSFLYSCSRDGCVRKYSLNAIRDHC